MTARAASRAGLLAAALLLIAGGGAWAESPGGGDGSQTGDGATRITGLAQAPEANLFVGAATSSVPIQVPPGRKGLTPQLALTYNSGGGPSPYGFGWDLPLPRVQRSTKRGVLACNKEYGIVGGQWHSAMEPPWHDFVVSLPGASLECTTTGNPQGMDSVRCEPRVEESFLRIEQQRATNTWAVWDKSGVRYEFGGASAATAAEAADPTSFPLPARTGSDVATALTIITDPMDVERCTSTFAWYLTAIVDPKGNRVDLRYRLHGGMLYPHVIRYGMIDFTSHPFEVRFVWEPRAADDRPLNGLGGFPATLGKRLTDIQVFFQSAQVRRYRLAYEAAHDPASAPDGRQGRQSFLESVTLLDRDDEVLTRADNQDAAGAFAYERTTAGFAGEIQVAAKPPLTLTPNALRFRDGNGHTWRDVFDINGDGFADLIDAMANQGCSGGACAAWQVYLGSEHGFASTAITWHLPDAVLMNAIRGGANKKTTIDLTGDGIADYLVVHSAVNWQVYPGTPASAGGGWGFGAPMAWHPPFSTTMFYHSSPASFAGWSGTQVTQDLIDMNGDGRVDFVRADIAGSWAVYPNTGTGFGPPQHFAGAFPALSFTTSTNGMVYGTFDINGDGLPDGVSSGQSSGGTYSGAWKVCLNTGYGMPLATGTGCASWALPAQGEWRLVRSYSASQPLDTVRDLFDINGDGLPDVVDKNGWGGPGGDGNWRVYLNRGHGFEQAPLLWPAPQFIRNGSAGGGATLADTFDINGDGLVDHVVFNTSAAQYEIHHPLGGAWQRAAGSAALAEPNPARVRPDLLVRSESGAGSETVLHYRPSTQWVNDGGDGVVDLPFPIWTVTEIRHRDGLCPLAQLQPDGSCGAPGHEVGSTIDYEGGRFDPIDRELRGFNRVFVRPLAAPGTPHATTLHVFHQTALWTGKVERTLTSDAATGVSIAETINEWQCAHRGSGAPMTCPSQPDGVAWVRLKRTTERAYSTPASQFRDRVTENVSWHECGGTVYGNVAEAWRGDPGGAPRLRTHTRYACRDDSGGYIVDRPSQVTVWNHDQSQVLEEKWFWYDGEPLGGVAVGEATRIDALVDVNDLHPAPPCANTPSAAGGCVTTTMSYDGYGNVTAVTDALGRTTSTTYDLAFNLYPWIVEQPAAAPGKPRHKVWTTYDLGCGVEQFKSIPYASGAPAATEATRYVHDTFCRLEQVRIPGDADAGTAYTRYVYHVGAPAKAGSAGKPTVTMTVQREPSHANGTVLSAVLADGLGRPIQSKTEAVVHGSLTATATATTYDSVGRAVRQYVPFVVAPAAGLFLTYTAPPGSGYSALQYDAAGRVTRTTNPDGTYRTATHTVAWETTSEDECVPATCTGSRTREVRDALGRTTERWVRNEGNTILARTRYTYDALDRLVRTEQGNATAGAAWNAATAVVVSYDTLGRKVRLEDPDSGVWHYRYDWVGNLVFQNDPRPDQHIALCYDGMDRLTRKYYLPFDTPLTSCTLPAHITYTYTETLYGLGQPATIVDASGQTQVVSYTVRGEPITVRRIMDGVTAETTTLYDSVGKPLGMMYPDGEVVVYTYDDLGRIRRLHNQNGAPVYLDNLTYDRFGRPVEIRHGNGTTDTRTYDSGNAFRLTRLRAAHGGTTLFDYGYDGYTATGLLTARSDAGWVSGQPSLLRAHGTYSYDGARRLTAVSDAVGGRGYGHDVWGNLTSKEGVSYAFADTSRPHRATGFSGAGSGQITYDANGNRGRRDAGGGWTEQHYRYDAEDRLQRITVGLDAPGSEAVEFAYDAGGRRTRERRGIVQANGSLQVQETTRYYSDLYEVQGTVARKYYVAGGLLIASREGPAPAHLQVAAAGGGGGEDTHLAWLEGSWGAGGPQLVARVPAGAALVVVILGGGLWLAVPGRRRRIGLGRTVRPADAVLVAVLSLTGALPWPLLVAPAAAQKGGTPAPTATPVPAVEIHHYHLDHLGSPQTITDGGGAIVHQVRYDPYGAVRGRWRPTTGGGYTLTLTALSEQDRREFTGYHLEPLSQLSYAGARFYDPLLATFLTHDPAREFASPYTYTGGDPINLNDPGGACVALCIDLLIVVAVGAAAGFAANAIQAAVSGASIGDIFKAGAIGAAMGAAGAGLGFAAGMAASAALTSAYGQAVSQTVMRAVGITMILGGAGQAAYGLTKGDYTGLIGMGISIGLGFALGRGDVAQGANGGGLARAGGENETALQQLGDVADLALQPKKQVVPNTAEYTRIEDALNTVPNTSVRGESLQRLQLGDYYTYEQRWGGAEALTWRGKTYVPTTSLDFESGYLGYQLTHEHFHVLEGIYSRSWLPNERAANRFTALVYDTPRPTTASSQWLYSRALGRLP